MLPVVSTSSLLSSSAGLLFSPSAFFHVCLNDGRLQLFSNTSRSLFPDGAAYSNHCLASARPPLQLHNLGSNSTVMQNNVQNFAWFRLASCQVMIGPRCVFPPNGSFCWLLVVLRVSYFICVCDLVWYDSFCFEKETFFLKQELLASSVINYCRLSLQLYLKLIKRCVMCLRLRLWISESVKLSVTNAMYISWEKILKSIQYIINKYVCPFCKCMHFNPPGLKLFSLFPVIMVILQNKVCITSTLKCIINYAVGMLH